MLKESYIHILLRERLRMMYHLWMLILAMTVIPGHQGFTSKLLNTELLESILSQLELRFIFTVDTYTSWHHVLWHHNGYLIWSFIELFVVTVLIQSIEAHIAEWVLLLHAEMHVEFTYTDIFCLEIARFSWCVDDIGFCYLTYFLGKLKVYSFFTNTWIKLSSVKLPH